MLVTLNEVLNIAEEKGCGIGAFNTPSLEAIIAVLEVAEELNSPVIIQHAQIHEEIMALDIIGPIMVGLAKKANVAVCVHLDHGSDIDYLERAMKMGFTSVMFDGSLLPYEENVAETRRVVEVAQKYAVNVEAEIGHVSGSEVEYCEDNEEHHEGGSEYTDPMLAKQFVEETKIDALAASFGTVHGFYKSQPKLDFERIEKIRKKTGRPLVMHGGSGVSAEDYQRAIARGIRKINYYSYMSNAGVKGVRAVLNEKEVYHYSEIRESAIAYMKKDVRSAMEVFMGN